MATTASPWPNTIMPQRSTPRLWRLEDGCARTLRNVQRALRVLQQTDCSTLLSPARPRFKTCGDASDRVSYDQRLNVWHECGKSGLVELAQSILLLATALFALSVVGTLVACGVFFWYDTDFWYYFDVGVVLKIAVVLLSGFVVSSGLLFWHFQRQESYMTFESIFFLVCLFLSLLNLLWIAPVLFFL